MHVSELKTAIMKLPLTDVEKAQAAATYVTHAEGGRGAAREVIEHILKAQNLWLTVVERYQ